MASINNTMEELSLDVKPQTSTTQQRCLSELPVEVMKIIAYFVFEESVEVDDRSPENDAYAQIAGVQYPKKLVRKIATPTYYVDRSRDINNDKRTPYFTTLLDRGNLSLAGNSTSILRLNKRFHEVAAPVLYELYQFQTFAAESFRLKFVKTVGPVNAASIRYLRIGLPFTIKVEPSKHMGRYIRMLEHELIGLKTFEITTEVERWRYPLTYSPCDTWVECHKGMLWFAGWLPSNHPSLKYAVWSEENTVNDNKLDDVYDGSWDTRKKVRLTVTITVDRPKGLRVMEDPKLIEARNDELLRAKDGRVPGAEIVEPASDILLDTYKIRRTGWKALGTKQACRPYQYQLQPDAINSEASKPDTLPNAIVEAEERYFHKKVLDFGKCVEPYNPQGSLDSISYLGAMAANHINVLQEELMFRGPPPPPQPQAPNEASGDDDEDHDDTPADDENNDDDGDGDGWGSGTEHESVGADNCEDENTPKSNSDEALESVDPWEDHNHACPW